MAWTLEDLLSCTHYGTLYRVKKIRTLDGALFIRRLRRVGSVFREETSAKCVYISGLPVQPEVGDLVFRSQDNAPSVIKSDHSLEHLFVKG